ncbi:MAG: hypothetical protein ABI583_07560 [Betaproteobacteria bacterium]
MTVAKTKIRRKSATKSPDQELSAPEDQVRHRIKRYLVQRFYTRFHMSLILMGAGMAAMVSNWTLLHWGVTKMWMRYPVAVTLSYLTFLAGVWLWIQYVEFRRDSGSKNSLVDGGDIPDAWAPGSGSGNSVEIPAVARCGGSFDGGGAAGEWADAAPAQAFASGSSPGASSTSSSGFKEAFSGFGDLGDLDGDAAIVIVLALLLIASLIIVSGYILWFAPDILSEAIFGATLAGSLARAAKREDNQGWITGVVKKTWWPFAIIFCFAMAFALYAASHYPAARTLGEAWQTALSR